MARDVQKIGAAEKPVVVSEAKASPAASLPQALPAPAVTWRARVVELCGSMMASVLLALLFAIVGAALLRTNDLVRIGSYFFISVACCWAVLLPSKFWTARVEDSWQRRLVLMVFGVLIGLGTLWLDGHQFASLFGHPAQREEGDAQAQALEEGVPGNGQPAPMIQMVRFLQLSSQQEIPIAACYLSYFGLAFFALRWWKMTDRRRAQRFSIFSVLSVAFWAYLLLLLWPVSTQTQGQPHGVVALVMASVIVQLVSPWEQPPPPIPRRLRLRYA
jgi:hypothetical protein